jgi:hypothetical protein
MARTHIAKVEWTDPAGHKWEVLTTYVSIDGRWQPVGWDIHCPDDHKPPHPLRREVRDAAPMQARPVWVVGIGPADVLPDGTLADVPDPEPVRGRPPKFTRDYYRQVANVFLLAVADGRSPRLAVRKEFNLPERTAARHIAKARTLGLLPPPDRKED